MDDLRCELIHAEKINMYQPIFLEYHQISSAGVWSSDNNAQMISQWGNHSWLNEYNQKVLNVTAYNSNIITVRVIRFLYIWVGIIKYQKESQKIICVWSVEYALCNVTVDNKMYWIDTEENQIYRIDTEKVSANITKYHPSVKSLDYADWLISQSGNQRRKSNTESIICTFCPRQ